MAQHSYDLHIAMALCSDGPISKLRLFIILACMVMAQHGYGPHIVMALCSGGPISKRRLRPRLLQPGIERLAAEKDEAWLYLGVADGTPIPAQ